MKSDGKKHEQSDDPTGGKRSGSAQVIARTQLLRKMASDQRFS